MLKPPSHASNFWSNKPNWYGNYVHTKDRLLVRCCNIHYKNFTIASLLLMISLITSLALATTSGQVPLPITLAKVSGSIHHLRIFHTLARCLFNESHLTPCWCCLKVGKIHSDRRACDVVHLVTERSVLTYLHKIFICSLLHLTVKKG